jgi:hypothetical protein
VIGQMLIDDFYFMQIASKYVFQRIFGGVTSHGENH